MILLHFTRADWVYVALNLSLHVGGRVLSHGKSRIFRFGQFELDPAQQRLSRNGIPLRLPASRIRLLHLFVTRSGELISRDEISSYLWNNSQTVDTVSGINTAVNQLRGHLGDDPASPRYIETVIGTGYRFIANVEQLEEPVSPSAEVAPVELPSPDAPPALPVQASPLPPVVRPGGRIVLVVAVVLVAATAISFWIRWRRAAHFAESSVVSVKLDRVTGSGDIESADISPDGKYIAYVRATGSEDSLWLKQLATGRVLELAAMGEDQCPGLMFSPDGSFVYFVRKAPLSASGDLYRVPFLGGNPTPILTGVSGAPAISPDGRRVAFVRSTLITHGEDSIVIASLDGSGERLLKSYKAPGVHFNRITWTADGRSLVYPLQAGLTEVRVDGSVDGIMERQIPGTSWRNVNDIQYLPPDDDLVAVGEPFEISNAQIFAIPTSGGAPLAITHDLSNYTAVRATADGNVLLAVQDLVLSSIEVLRPNKESELRTLSAEKQSSDGIGGLEWTPEGNILYTSESNRGTQMFEVQPDGQHLQHLNFDLTGSLLSNPVVSPHGDFVAVVQWKDLDVANIWRMGLNGRESKRLTTGKQDVSPSVTPDGRWIVYSSVEGERSVLKKVASDGGMPIQLTDYNADSPVVSPDGGQIACSYTPDAKQPAMLAIVSISGGPPAKVFSLPKTATPRLAWKPDGTSVLFINRVNGADNIWQQPLSGAPAVAVTHLTSGKIFGFRWSRDGTIALSRGTETVDAVLIKNFRD